MLDIKTILDKINYSIVNDTEKEEKMPKNTNFYAVSNAPGRLHLLGNFLNWQPKFPKK